MHLSGLWIVGHLTALVFVANPYRDSKYFWRGGRRVRILGQRFEGEV